MSMTGSGISSMSSMTTMITMGITSWVVSMSTAVNNSVETIVFVGSVVNGTDCAVWFNEGVRSFDYITIAGFMLRFLVTGMGIFYSIFEFVMSWSLRKNHFYSVHIAHGHITIHPEKFFQNDNYAKLIRF